MNEEPWREHARCASLLKSFGPELVDHLFFPECKPTDKARVERRIFCSGCPVRAECLDAGLHEEFGVWGGTGRNERRRIAKERAT